MDDVKSKSYWFNDLIQSKINEVKPILNKNLSPELNEKIWSDKLTKQDCIKVIGTLFENLENLWSSEDILQAWEKSRSTKNNKCSDSNRTEGNQNVKSEKWTKGLIRYCTIFFHNSN